MRYLPPTIRRMSVVLCALAAAILVLSPIGRAAEAPNKAKAVEAVLDRAGQVGVVAVVCSAGNVQDSAAAVGLARRQGSVYCTAGVHPHDAAAVGADYLADLERLAGDAKNVAIGEIGLDYHYNYSPPDDQRRVLADQLDLAGRLGKKVVIHTREALDDTLAVLADSPVAGQDVVFHSCSEHGENINRVLATGAMVGLSGMVTFKKADDLRLAAQEIPLDRLLIETDSPFLSPVPVRKRHPNEPANVAHVAACLAEVRGISAEQLAETTTANAIGFFGLDVSPA